MTGLGWSAPEPTNHDTKLSLHSNADVAPTLRRPSPFTPRNLPFKAANPRMPVNPCGQLPGDIELNTTETVGVLCDRFGRYSAHAETDQKSGLRPDGHETSGGAHRPGRLQRERCGGGLRHSAGSAGKDSATPGKS